ncbi:taurine ABC transporter substrate-binding protein [Aminobacter sp. MDW-2]|uniref:taurine ABC transporter substrate-binding protein n=1 Tax=Aminobacter sp. MDW-2 TaxID=2666139 RepID=UPI0012AEF92F|nr:taurine ABC transporter substrate-binding protein [Aminobacter sp. MDW-2]MRX37414.1 taurine ABC transporter substrate-binding protein [Aminobacter sp. MDW-2]QNH35619.1 taurine ABC transporter substrate-binding protein [Aminobacter sp. MDW-2]
MLRNAIKILSGSALIVGMVMGAATAAEKVVIGEFGNPTPMQVAVAEKKFEAATGWDIEWRKFASGADVIAAMASGDIKLAELGSSPLAIAASQGVDLQLFMFAQVIGEAESLIVRNESGITKLDDLKGKRVAVPVGSTAHFSLMGAIKHAGLSETDVTVMNMPPDQIAAAWQQGAIDAAFIWQPVQAEILKNGTLLVGADKTAAWGFPTFDGWVVNKEFAAANSDALVAFAKTMNEANLAYLADPAAWTPDSVPVKTIAERTGAAPEQIPTILKGFAFVPLSDQVGDTWLGGAPATMKATAEFLKGAGRINSALGDYNSFVNVDIAKQAGK